SIERAVEHGAVVVLGVDEHLVGRAELEVERAGAAAARRGCAVALDVRGRPGRDPGLIGDRALARLGGRLAALIAPSAADARAHRDRAIAGHLVEAQQIDQDVELEILDVGGPRVLQRRDLKHRRIGVAEHLDVDAVEPVGRGVQLDVAGLAGLRRRRWWWTFAARVTLGVGIGQDVVGRCVVPTAPDDEGDHAEDKESPHAANIHRLLALVLPSRPVNRIDSDLRRKPYWLLAAALALLPTGANAGGFEVPDQG